MTDLLQVETIPEALHDGAGYRRFFLALGAFLVVPLSLLTLSVVFLWRSHELSSYRQIVAWQREHGGVYGPGTSVDYVEYKLELIDAERPETVALGSSRALGFQAPYFAGSFVNAGSGMRSLDEGRVFLEEMLKVHTPKRVILALDFWWFNKATPPSPPTWKAYDKSAITTDKLLLPYRLISEGKLSVGQFLAVIFLNDHRNELTHYDNTGVMGLLSSNGNRADGSMLYGEFALGGRTDLDPRFSHASELVSKGYGNYEFGEHPDPDRLAEFSAMLHLLREHGVQVYLVVPPVSPAIHALMAQPPERYRFIDEWREHLKTLGVPVFDFHDANAIPATDCEFVDGYHSGDVTYLKLLVHAAASAEAPELASAIRVEDAKRTISRFDGNVIDRSAADRFPDAPEKDFLLLGCEKR